MYINILTGMMKSIMCPISGCCFDTCTILINAGINDMHYCITKHSKILMHTDGG